MIWNEYLGVFKNPSNDCNLLDGITELLKQFFNVMSNSIKNLENQTIVDYDRDNKIQVYANIGVVLARQLEIKSDSKNEVIDICSSLLLTPLNPHTRKLINSIKARHNKTKNTNNITISNKNINNNNKQDNKKPINSLINYNNN